MTTVTDMGSEVTLGVDTHKDNHVGAVLDTQGRVLDTETFPTTSSGYERLHLWAEGFGPIDVAGVEGTGSWGVGLTRYLTGVGVVCVEVNRPNRQHRRRHGKSDTADAIGAAKAVQAGEATGTPRGNNGLGEGLRVNRIAHRSAIRARTQAINQLRSLITTAPEQLRERFMTDNMKNLSITKVVAIAVSLRPDRCRLDPINTTKAAMLSLAKRINFLNNELDDLAAQRQLLVEAAAPPELLNETGIGPAVAADILIAFGDNPDRISSEASFAALCGASPIDCSSGQQIRHRLNRGGDRQANNALWRIVIVRLSCHQPTRDYMTQSTTKGKTKKETIRNLKRYTARHLWRLLQTHPPTLDYQ